MEHFQFISLYVAVKDMKVFEVVMFDQVIHRENWHWSCENSILINKAGFKDAGKIIESEI